MKERRRSAGILEFAYADGEWTVSIDIDGLPPAMEVDASRLLALSQLVLHNPAHFRIGRVAWKRAAAGGDEDHPDLASLLGAIRRERDGGVDAAPE
jgi:hypothetical protein